MLSLLLGIIPLVLVVFILIIGFCLGFTFYSIILKINVRKGNAFVKSKDGKWEPFDPYIGSGSYTIPVREGRKHAG
jgi:hypothetical protein